MNQPTSPNPAGFSRRDFIKTGAAASVALPLIGSLPQAFAAGTDRIRIGLVGCGGRGLGAVRNCVAADPAVQVVALGDIFADKVEEAFKDLSEGHGGQYPAKPLPADQFKVTKDKCFSGWDAYKSVIASGLDIVLLVTPPHFRPLHLAAALEAGVNAFIEKPVAVDVAGVRRMLELAEVANKKGLAVVVGTQRRHAANYLETMQRIHDGALGELVGGQCYWLQGALWHKGRDPKWSEMEYQIRNWLYFTWLSGDHIVEQHVHNLDVMNWAYGGPPVKAVGMGGRQSRTEPIYGNAYDHFAIEYEYANGARVASFCRQAHGATSRVSERVVGTKGSADPAGTIIAGGQTWKAPEFNMEDSLVQEHRDLIASIRAGKPLNDTKRIAESTLTAIMGRVSAYTGREVSFQWLLKASKLDLTPAGYSFDIAPPVEIPIPGVTPLV